MLDFLGIGAQKSGTSWLHSQLNQHPALAFPAGKEVHFFDLHFERGLDWYQSQFTSPAGKRLGEITPAYAMLPVERIQALRSIYPQVRLIYSLRNPIDRAWSAARMALQRAEMTPEEASDAWFIDHFRSQGSRRRGDYETCLRNWRQVFPSDQLLLIFFEAIQQQPRAVLDRCCQHIGVALFPAVPECNLQRRVFASVEAELRPSLRAVLDEIYRPQIRSLADYLEVDLNHWIDANAAGMMP